MKFMLVRIAKCIIIDSFFFEFVYLSRVQYKLLKSYHAILKFQVDDKEQKMSMLSHILKHISIDTNHFMITQDYLT